MTNLAAGERHEIYAWNAGDLIKEMQKLKAAAKVSIDANDSLKNTLNADIVALTQLVQSSAKIAKQVKLLGITGRAYIKEIKGVSYVIFKGNGALRPNLQGTRYLAENAKIKCFVIGNKQILEDVTRGTKVAVIAFVVIDIFNEVVSDHPSLASLSVRITSDVVQALIASAAGYVAGVVIVATVPVAPVVLTFVVVVAVGFSVGMLLTQVDRDYKLTERARARMMEYEQRLKQNRPLIQQRGLAFQQAIGKSARDIGGEVANEFYKVDRYFCSLADAMMGDAGRVLSF